MKHWRACIISLLILGSTLFASVTLMGCGEQPAESKAASEKLRVFVNIPPQAYLAERIGGEHVEVTTLVEPGDNPHTFTATPRQMMALGRADLYFRGSMPFEQRLVEKLKGSKMNIVNLNNGIELRRLGARHDEHHDEHHGEHHEEHHDAHHDHAAELENHLDPHVWLSPKALKKQARNIATAFQKNDPEHKSAYQANVERVLKQITELDKRLQKSLAPYKNRTFYVFHPAFGYFARAYHLHQEAVQVGGQDPTPKDLQNLISQAKKDNVRIIFVQPQFKSRSAKAVADAINGAVVPLDPLKRNVLDNLEKIAEAVQKVFQEN